MSYVVMDPQFFMNLRAPVDCEKIQYEDAETPGLILEAFKDGSVVFSFDFRDEDESTCRYRLGRYPRVGVDLAQREVARILNEIINGIFPHNMELSDHFSPDIREVMQFARLEIGDAMDLPSY